MALAATLALSGGAVALARPTTTTPAPASATTTPSSTAPTTSPTSTTQSVPQVPSEGTHQQGGGDPSPLVDGDTGTTDTTEPTSARTTSLQIPSSTAEIPSSTPTTTPAEEQVHPVSGKKIPFTGKPTENPNDKVIPGKMRSDREEIGSSPSGVPGTPLRRTMDQQQIQDNRNDSCNKIVGGRTGGKSCDEYPFASTREGADANPTGGRTFSNCGITSMTPLDPVTDIGPNGFSMCMINARQNSRGGGIASWFYAKNRLLDGETFYVNATY
ncbi:NucA/NucB deoxyribonuclease domain-containing protein [Rhodococcus sp. NPDC054953]